MKAENTFILDRPDKFKFSGPTDRIESPYLFWNSVAFIVSPSTIPTTCGRNPFVETLVVTTGYTKESIFPF